mgnify:CR=1 FL=1
MGLAERPPTSAPWFFAGIVAYFATALVIVEPLWWRRFLYAVLSFGVVYLFLGGRGYETYAHSFWKYVLLGSLFVLTMAPTYESRTGPVLGLYVVADGMGGHASGEIASRMALQVMVERVMQSIILPELAGELVLEDEVLALLRQATIAAAA